MNYKDLNPDQTKRTTHVISTLSVGPNNNYKHVHLNVLNLHTGLCPHWIRQQNIEGTISEALCYSGPEWYCVLWHLVLDPQAVLWDYTLLAWITVLHEMKKTHTSQTQKLPTAETSEEPNTWLHLRGLNKHNCGVLLVFFKQNQAWAIYCDEQWKDLHFH